MKSCHYCGRENDDATVRCVECGTELEIPNAESGPKPKSLLRTPGSLVWLLALIVFAQGMIRLALTPHDPSLGEGDHKRVEAAFYFWLSLGVSIVFFAYGFYLRKRDTNEHVA
ncbi:MAG: hypothetical protein IH623_13940 [Verrucomicrobia bacterium]|nr:hypothetical protein [Verrucomicrobiota bacterium]